MGEGLDTGPFYTALLHIEGLGSRRSPPGLVTIGTVFPQRWQPRNTRCTPSGEFYREDSGPERQPRVQDVVIWGVQGTLALRIDRVHVRRYVELDGDRGWRFYPYLTPLEDLLPPTVDPAPGQELGLLRFRVFVGDPRLQSPGHVREVEDLDRGPWRDIYDPTATQLFGSPIKIQSVVRGWITRRRLARAEALRTTTATVQDSANPADRRRTSGHIMATKMQALVRGHLARLRVLAMLIARGADPNHGEQVLPSA